MMRCLLAVPLLFATSPLRAGLPTSPSPVPAPAFGAGAGGVPPVFAPDAVTLPERADERVIVRAPSGMRLAFSLEGTSGAGVELATGRARFPEALAIGARRFDVTLVPVAGGVEDYVHFEVEPEQERVRYRVDVSEAAGLRLVADTLELLDAGGVPRLRMSPPTIVDTRGVTHDARVSVSGCAFDVDPRGPWGRPVVAPAARECTVEVRWGRAIGAPIDYPAVLDPAWVQTAWMAQSRHNHMAVLLADGRVLVAGGYSVVTSSTYQARAELYDPASGTWAAARAMNRPRANTRAIRFTSGPLEGQVLIAGGDDALRPSAELYDPATGNWTTTDDLQVPRDVHPMVLLASGQVLAAGGCSRAGNGTCLGVENTAEVFDPETGTWSFAPGQMSDARAYFSLTLLEDGRVLAAGGCKQFHSSGNCNATVASADLFDPTTGEWTRTDPMPNPAQLHVALRLPDGTVLIAGGVRLGVLRRETTRFDPATGDWSSVGDLLADHDVAAGVVLPSGQALITGSWGVTAGPNLLALGDATIGARVTSAETEVYDPARGTWTFGPAMVVAHGAHSATLLEDGAVLVAGGLTQQVAGELESTRGSEVLAPAGADPMCPDALGLGDGCARCATAACCDALAACAGDPTCRRLGACFAKCSAARSSKGCLESCGATCPEGEGAFRVLMQCVTSTCQVACIETTPAPNTVVACTEPEPGPEVEPISEAVEAGPEAEPEPVAESEAELEPAPDPEPEPAAEVVEADSAATAEVTTPGDASRGGCGGAASPWWSWLATLALLGRMRRRAHG